MGIWLCKLGCPLLLYMETVGSSVGNSVDSPLYSSKEIVGSSVGNPLNCPLLNWSGSHLWFTCKTFVAHVYIMHVIVNNLKSVFTKHKEWTSCILNFIQHDGATSKLIKLHPSIHLLYFTLYTLRCQRKFRLHLSPTLIHFNKFVSLNSMQNKVHELTFWS